MSVGIIAKVVAPSRSGRRFSGDYLLRRVCATRATRVKRDSHDIGQVLHEICGGLVKPRGFGTRGDEDATDAARVEHGRRNG